jgi:hypothetical protein
MSSIIDVKKKLRLILKKPDAGDHSKDWKQPITPFIWGRSGIGKSQAVRQIAGEYGIGFIDLRLSQLESVDLRGLPVPDLEHNTARWLPPEFLPFEGIPRFKDSSGILLLDEFNRARPDVLQAAFQLVLDRQVGLHRLLDSWFIVAAGNLGDEDNTDVVEMDAALKNRFIHLTIDVDADAWISWAKERFLNPDIIDFIRNRPDYLYYMPNTEDTVFVSPRSWEKFSDILAQNPLVDPLELSALLGPDIIASVAAPFVKYLELRQTVSGRDVVYGYGPDIERRIRRLQRDQLYSLNAEVIEAILSLKSIEPDHLERVRGYTALLEKDMYVAFLRTLAERSSAAPEVPLPFIDRYLETFSDEARALIRLLKP